MKGRLKILLASAVALCGAALGALDIAAEPIRPHANAVLHSFPGEQVYPESVAIDGATGALSSSRSLLGERDPGRQVTA